MPSEVNFTTKDGSSVKGSFKGFEELLKSLKGKAYETRIGILKTKDKGRNDALTNAQVGAFNEFGTEHKAHREAVVMEGLKREYGVISQQTPARSFLRMPIFSFSKEISNKVRVYMNALLKRKEKDFIFKSMRKIGEECYAKVDEAFKTGGFGRWAPNAPSTLKRKGDKGILIDSGQLRKNIGFDVVEKK